MCRCFLLSLLFASVTACTADTNCQQSLRDKCLSCHGSATTCAKLGASEEQWLQTIDAMIKLKANISPQKRSQLARCLTRADSPGVREFCSSD